MPLDNYKTLKRDQTINNLEDLLGWFDCSFSKPHMPESVRRDFTALALYTEKQNPDHRFAIHVVPEGLGFGKFLFTPGSADKAPALYLYSDAERHDDYGYDERRMADTAEALRFSLYAAVGACNGIYEFSCIDHATQQPIGFSCDIYNLPKNIFNPRGLIALDAQLAGQLAKKLGPDERALVPAALEEKRIKALSPFRRAIYRQLQKLRTPFHEKLWPAHSALNSSNGLNRFDITATNALTEKAPHENSFFGQLLFQLYGSKESLKRAMDFSINFSPDNSAKKFLIHVADDLHKAGKNFSYPALITGLAHRDLEIELSLFAALARSFLNGRGEMSSKTSPANLLALPNRKVAGLLPAPDPKVRRPSWQQPARPSSPPPVGGAKILAFRHGD